MFWILAGFFIVLTMPIAVWYAMRLHRADAADRERYEKRYPFLSHKKPCRKRPGGSLD